MKFKRVVERKIATPLKTQWNVTVNECEKCLSVRIDKCIGVRILLLQDCEGKIIIHSNDNK